MTPGRDLAFLPPLRHALSDDHPDRRLPWLPGHPGWPGGPADRTLGISLKIPMSPSRYFDDPEVSRSMTSRLSSRPPLSYVGLLRNLGTFRDGPPCAIPLPTAFVVPARRRLRFCSSPRSCSVVNAWAHRGFPPWVAHRWGMPRGGSRSAIPLGPISRAADFLSYFPLVLATCSANSRPKPWLGRPHGASSPWVRSPIG